MKNYDKIIIYDDPICEGMEIPDKRNIYSSNMFILYDEKGNFKLLKNRYNNVNDSIDINKMTGKNLLKYLFGIK